MKVLTINNQKGGVGKTMLAVHAAWFFSEIKMQRTLFIDLDPQHNASGVLKDAAVDQTSFDLLTMAISVPPWPLTLLPAIRHLSQIVAPTEFPGDTVDAQALIAQTAANLETAAESFDIAIIDTSPAWSVKSLVALSVSDYLLSPIDLEDFSIDGIEELQRSVQMVKMHTNPRLQFLGLVPSRVQTGSQRQRQALVSIVQSFGGDLIFAGAAISQRSAFAEAMSERRPVWHDPKTAARTAKNELFQVLEPLSGRVMAVQPAAA